MRCTDLYSANEVGYIAFRCREQGALHVQSESLLVEVLDDAGQPCAPGETGRVVVTSLHNLATPLLRYEIGDYAEVGAPCKCGRGLPVLARVQGRVRNLVRTPDGRRYWPVSLGRIRTVTPIIQAQFVQTALDTVELRVVCSRALSPEETADAVVKTRQALGYPVRRAASCPWTRSRGARPGKFEEFLSLVDTAVGARDGRGQAVRSARGCASAPVEIDGPARTGRGLAMTAHDRAGCTSEPPRNAFSSDPSSRPCGSCARRDLVVVGPDTSQTVHCHALPAMS